jgi:hypothetical protein
MKNHLVLSLLMIMFGAVQLAGQVSQVNVTTWHNDNWRTGQNTSETVSPRPTSLKISSAGFALTQSTAKSTLSRW